jgi:hypothetical protein
MLLRSVKSENCRVQPRHRFVTNRGEGQRVMPQGISSRKAYLMEGVLLPCGIGAIDGWIVF